MSAPLGSLLAHALASERESEDALAERILGATVAEAAAKGLRGFTIDDVARRAATTRMTIYRRFGQRERLIEAMAVHEMRSFTVAIDAATSRFETIEEKGVEAFVAGSRFMRRHALVRRAIESEPEAIVAMLDAENGLVLAMGSGLIAEGLRGAGMEDEHTDELAETLARIFVSFLLLPRSAVALDDEEAIRRYVRACVTPLVTARR